MALDAARWKWQLWTALFATIDLFVTFSAFGLAAEYAGDYDFFHFSTGRFWKNLFWLHYDPFRSQSEFGPLYLVRLAGAGFLLARSARGCAWRVHWRVPFALHSIHLASSAAKFLALAEDCCLLKHAGVWLNCVGGPLAMAALHLLYTYSTPASDDDRGAYGLVNDGNQQHVDVEAGLAGALSPACTLCEDQDKEWDNSTEAMAPAAARRKVKRCIHDGEHELKMHEAVDASAGPLLVQVWFNYWWQWTKYLVIVAFNTAGEPIAWDE